MEVTSFFKNVVRCLFTPRLYKIYSSGPNENNFQSHTLERWGDNVWKITWYIGYYSSPLLILYLHSQEFLTPKGVPSLLRILGGISLLYGAALVTRAIGRASNAKYLQFVRALMAPEAQRVDILRQYDFEFYAFPITYEAPKKLPEMEPNLDKVRLPWYRKKVVDWISAIVVSTFGLRMIYPGSLPLIHNLIWSELVRGRKELVEKHHGKRHKIRTPSGNHIEAMFVDNRGRALGRTLVVCCEGNSGFYEVGVMGTPISGDYSVLGWNHPGFGGSTGKPYPAQEREAIESMMEFAIRELGFPVERIVLFGWSIGGYSAAWAAKRYPNIKYLVLDATFDDLMPLALARMPQSWRSLVKSVVRDHVNLNIGDLVLDYPGELLVVRRLNDEIICLREGDLSTNCCNELLLRVLRHRHPDVMTAAVDERIEILLGLQADAKKDVLRRMASSSDLNMRQASVLVLKYLADYESSHCTPLPLEHFIIPADF